MREDALDHRRPFNRGDFLKLTATRAALDLDTKDESLPTGRIGSIVPFHERQQCGKLGHSRERVESAITGPSPVSSGRV